MQLAFEFTRIRVEIDTETQPDRRDWITIISVIRRLGYEPEKSLTWPVGKRVEKIWVMERGEAPWKPLGSKTNSGGTHCIARYPPDWFDRICAVILEHRVQEARQPQFQFEDAE
jgi:hypothetical protein